MWQNRDSNVGGLCPSTVSTLPERYALCLPSLPTPLRFDCFRFHGDWDIDGLTQSLAVYMLQFSMSDTFHGYLYCGMCDMNMRPVSVVSLVQASDRLISACHTASLVGTVLKPIQSVWQARSLAHASDNSQLASCHAMQVASPDQAS